MAIIGTEQLSPNLDWNAFQLGTIAVRHAMSSTCRRRV